MVIIAFLTICSVVLGGTDKDFRVAEPLAAAAGQTAGGQARALVELLKVKQWTADG